MERPGIKDKTFKIKFDKNWFCKKENLLLPTLKEYIQGYLDEYKKIKARRDVPTVEKMWYLQQAYNLINFEIETKLKHECIQRKNSKE